VRMLALIERLYQPYYAAGRRLPQGSLPMPRLVAVCSGVFGLAIALGRGEAAAQSTSTCMAMGPNMVHCDTMNMGPPSESVAPSQSGGDGAIGRIVGYIALAHEGTLRKRVGKLLANGDCQGAARVALENGALELGQSISATCPQRQPSVALDSSGSSRLEQTAAGLPASGDCTPDKIRYSQSIGVDCHSLSARWP
jgi:hypothetical protein